MTDGDTEATWSTAADGWLPEMSKRHDMDNGIPPAVMIDTSYNAFRN